MIRSLSEAALHPVEGNSGVKNPIRLSVLRVATLSIATSILAIATSGLIPMWVAGVPLSIAGIPSKVARAVESETDGPLSDTSTQGPTHWAFRRLQRPVTHTPSVADESSQPIDQFIATAQRQAGVNSVELADRRTLVRRLFYDLIGLPPTPDEVNAFLSDNTADAFERLVDRLLEWPEFGERWGRHWLDVARYADSNGCSIESNNTYDNAWRYRDYVITALNEDKPYDQFVIEQIAGDLLSAVSDQQRSRQLIATGFLLLGPKAFGTSGFERFQLDVVDEQVDTIGKALLGLSLGCARCHDHKFDPITAEDYYALAGIFSSTHSVHQQKGWRQGRTWNRVVLPGLDSATAEVLVKEYQQRVKAAAEGELLKQAKSAVEEAKKRLEKLKKSKEAADEVAVAQQQLAQAERAVRNAGKAKKVLPIVSPVPVAMAVADREQPVDEQFRYRGQADEKGDRISRRVPPLFHVGQAGRDGQADREGQADRFAIPSHTSGRLQLAQWLVDVDLGAGPLLARVCVNRIWNHLMGRPLVSTIDNFGIAGSNPSHPELLEYLAATMVEDGWSVKRIIRRIVQTRTYRLAAIDHPRAHQGLRAHQRPLAQQVDPDNRLLWRHQIKRMDAESLRDTLLMLSGMLDRQRGGKTLQHLGLLSISSDYMELDTPSPYRRRSVYLPILRDAFGFSRLSDEALGLLATFDFADPNLMCGGRTTTTVPTQSLFFMNSPFLMDQSRKIAQRLLEEQRFSTDRERMEEIFLRVLGRPVGPQELQESLHYLAVFPELTRGENETETEQVRLVSGQASLLGSPPQQVLAKAEFMRASTQKDKLDKALEAWSSFCQALLGCNEFLFLN
ncbi:MAG: DUF1549 and DUF1553 domain-containing protein [Pirellulales bacterium]